MDELKLSCAESQASVQQHSKLATEKARELKENKDRLSHSKVAHQRRLAEVSPANTKKMQQILDKQV